MVSIVHVGVAVISCCYHVSAEGRNFSSFGGSESKGYERYYRSPEIYVALFCFSLMFATKQFIASRSLIYKQVYLLRKSSKKLPLNKGAQVVQGRLKESYEEPPWLTKFMAFLNFRKQVFVAYVSSTFFPPPVSQEKNRQGYGQLYGAFELLFARYLLRKFRDCFGRPICSTPGVQVTLKERITRDNGWTFQFTGETRKCVNLGSFNYMGFADSAGPCAEDAQEAVKQSGVAYCTSRQELGSSPLHADLEAALSRFLGVEAAAVFGMGFTTNSSNLSCLLSKGCLAVSDEKNHASMITGMRLAAGTVRVYKHNDMASLESTLREAITHGQPRTHRPWKRIFIVIEGIYSMDGTIVNLPEIVALKKKYKTYIYIDEAHSMGAIGRNGRGTVGHYGLDPKDVDVQMGTLSKTFGSAGAYIAGTKKLIDFLRVNSSAMAYETTMAPAAVQQSLSAVRIMLGEDGTDTGKRKVQQLADNVRYFRRRLHEMGVIVYGHEDSPVVPVLVISLSKLADAIRSLKDMNIAAVGVTFPATPLLKSRMRFCLSAGHTRQQLDLVLDAMDNVSGKVGFKDSRSNLGWKNRAKTQ